MSRTILDAGALIALVRNDRAVWAEGGTLYTSDAKDLRRLIAACGRTAPVIGRC